jgi:hypothetical protein
VTAAGAHAPAHHDQLALALVVTHHGGRVVREHSAHRRQVADVSVDDPEERGHGKSLRKLYGKPTVARQKMVMADLVGPHQLSARALTVVRDLLVVMATSEISPKGEPTHVPRRA